MGGNSPYAKGRIYTMGANIIEIQNKKRTLYYLLFGYELSDSSRGPQGF